MDERILVVDDEPDILHILSKALIREGYKVRSTLGGAEAIDLFKTEPFDLIVTDIRMPGTDGLEVIRQVRQLDEETEIIVLTAYPSVDIVIQTLKNFSVYDFLTKPLKDIGYFVVTVEKALERRRLCRDRKEYTAEMKILNKRLKQEVGEHKRTEEALLEREWELEIKTKNLEETNAALKILLRKREEDKAELEEKVLANVKELVMPYLEKLKRSGLNARQKNFMGIMESNLDDIVSPFVHGLSDRYLMLTPSEIRVANLVKQGKNTKEIAELVSLSPRTIESYRDSIREKLGIKNKKINLRTYLFSFK
ncbi:response regulator [Desulfobacterales bacterium HSG2]|nr:response regulator [Desulfobacterales bacterium HSG2]